MLSSPSPSSSGQLSQLGASLYGPQSKCLVFPTVLVCSTFLVNFTKSFFPLCVSSVSLRRCTRFLGKGHGEQYASVKPKFNTRHATTKSYHPHDRGPRHVPPYPSITKQVCMKLLFVSLQTHTCVVYKGK